jgi:UDP-glucose 4-epimerase
MRIYITGGTGFIGSYVLRELADGRNEIVVLARDPGKVPALRSLPRVRIVKAPMQDPAAIRRHLTGPDALVHIALCWGDTAVEMLRNETIPSVDLLALAAERGAKKVLFTSSTAAVGYREEKIYENTFRRPDDYYGATKGSVELFIDGLSRQYPGTRFNVIRPGYTFGNPVVEGASTENDKRMKSICAKVRRGEDVELGAGDGTQFIWAGHLAKLYRAVLASGVKNEIFYGLSRNFLTWAAIAEMAAELAGSRSVVSLKGKAGRPHLFQMDKVRKYFGLSFDNRKEMKEHVRWLLSQP